MRSVILRLWGVALLIVMALYGGTAHATLVYIDGKAGGATQFIEAGTYRASLVGGAWNAWGGAVGGGQGWLNNWGATLPGGGQIWNGTGVYGTPLQAFSAAQDIYFTVPTTGTMVFTNGDPKQFLDDNVGGTSISITKSLGSAKKDNWNFAKDIAGYAGQIATVVSIAMASVTAGGVLAAMSVFIALGLAATSLALLAQGGPLSTGNLISGLLNIKALVIDLVSANYLGQPLLSGAVKASIFGLIAAGIEIGAAWMAKDPPNYNYSEVPILQSPIFNAGNTDDAFANSAVLTVDAWRVAMDSLEKYQGALIDGNEHFAALQLQTYNKAIAAIADNMGVIQKKMDDVYPALSPAVYDPANLEFLKNQFLSTDLPDYIQQQLPALNISEDEFRNIVIENISKLPTNVSHEEIVYQLNRGIDVPLASVLELSSSEVPEPTTIFLILIGVVAYFTVTTRRDSCCMKASG